MRAHDRGAWPIMATYPRAGAFCRQPELKDDLYIVSASVQDTSSDDAAEMVAEVTRSRDVLEKMLNEFRMQQLLGGPYDEGNAIITIQVPPLPPPPHTQLRLTSLKVAKHHARVIVKRFHDEL